MRSCVAGHEKCRDSNTERPSVCHRAGGATRNFSLHFADLNLVSTNFDSCREPPRNIPTLPLAVAVSPVLIYLYSITFLHLRSNQTLADQMLLLIQSGKGATPCKDGWNDSSTKSLITRRSLDFREDPMASESTNSPVTKGKQSIHRRRLLVVGKNLEGLTARGAFLEGSGYQVFTCCSHNQAVRSLQSEVFDFVLLSQGSRSQLVALDWGQRAPAKVSAAPGARA